HGPARGASSSSQAPHLSLTITTPPGRNDARRKPDRMSGDLRQLLGSRSHRPVVRLALPEYVVAGSKDSDISFQGDHEGRPAEIAPVEASAAKEGIRRPEGAHG